MTEKIEAGKENQNLETDPAGVIGITLACILFVVALASIVYAGFAHNVPLPAVLAVLAITVPFIAMLLVPLAALSGSGARAWFATIFGGFSTAALTISLLPYALAARYPADVLFELEWIPAVDVKFGLFLDTLGVTVAIIGGLVGALALLYSTRFMEREEGLTRYYCIMLLFIGGMIGFGLSDNLIALYFFWEILGLCSFALIGFWFKDQISAKAGMKAFVVTRFGDIGLLVGLLALFVGYGTLSIQAITAAVMVEGIILTGILMLAGGCFILAAAGKSAQVPLHVWLPDAMEGPTTVSALIHAACMVNAGIYLIARTTPIFVDVPHWQTAILMIGATTALLAAILATVEVDFKRVIAYCTISQLGYMMAALGLVGGLLAGTYHLMNHSMFKALMFLCAGSVIYALGGTVHKHANMHKIRGIASIKQMPITNITFLIGLLALIGLPPFGGFWSKEMILATAALGNGSSIELIAFGVLAGTAVLTVVYSARMYYYVFMGEPAVKAKESPAVITIPLIILAAATTVSWLYIDAFTKSMHALLPEFIPHISIPGLIHKTFIYEAFISPIIIATVICLLSGYLVFTIRERIYAMVPALLKEIIARKYGFDDLYKGVFVKAYFSWSGSFRKLQTGDLNYNVMGVVLAFVIITIMTVALIRGGI
ncbi:MAG: NADH-quinone oxidoreductase subunit L [Methanophagales archaeon]|nr:NADH-quinone oxidoreductase subunit L [Methanophagales archaeon]